MSRLALNRSTVYRTLETLAEIGVVRATRMDRAVHYEVTHDGDDHHRLRCMECQAMVHFDAGEVDQLLREDARKAAFAVSDLQVLINGVCAACRKTRPAAV